MCAQIAYNRGLVSMEERNRVFRVMKRLQLPFWHPVCCTQLFYKVLCFPALGMALPSISAVTCTASLNLIWLCRYQSGGKQVD